MGKEGVTRGRHSDAPRNPRVSRYGQRPETKRGGKAAAPENEDEGAESRVDWRRLGPALLVGVAGGLLGVFIATGGGLMRNVAIGLLGLLLGVCVLRALGLSIAVRSPVAAQVIAAAIGAGAVLLMARMLA